MRVNRLTGFRQSARTVPDQVGGDSPSAPLKKEVEFALELIRALSAHR